MVSDVQLPLLAAELIVGWPASEWTSRALPLPALLRAVLGPKLRLSLGPLCKSAKDFDLGRARRHVRSEELAQLCTREARKLA